MSALDTPTSPIHQPRCSGGELDTPAGFSVDSWSVGRLLARLQASFIEDDELDDALNASLDPDRPLSFDDMERLTPRLRRIAWQLVDIAGQRDAYQSAAELADVEQRVRQLGGPVHGDLVSARGRLRLLALAVLDVLELVSEDDERPLSDFAAAPFTPDGRRP